MSSRWENDARRLKKGRPGRTSCLARKTFTYRNYDHYFFKRSRIIINMQKSSRTPARLLDRIHCQRHHHRHRFISSQRPRKTIKPPKTPFPVSYIPPCPTHSPHSLPGTHPFHSSNLVHNLFIHSPSTRSTSPPISGLTSFNVAAHLSMSLLRQ